MKYIISKFHPFHLILTLFFGIFITIMVYVTYRAYTRQTGSTGMDMAQIQKIRYDTSVKQQSSQTKSEPSDRLTSQ